MNANQIKLIAMDMDGTLLNHQQEISKENQAALKEAVAQGIVIAICSGRSCGDSSYYASDCGLDCFIISLNGAYCLESPHGIAYARHTMDERALTACVDILYAHGGTYACFQDNRIIVVDGPGRKPSKKWGTHRHRPGAPEYAYGIQALEQAKAKGICKIVYVEEDMRLLEDMRHKLLSIQGMDVTSSWVNNLELMPSGVNKGTSVQELAHKLGLTHGQVMTLGDFDNDIPMLQYAGWGVAMGNATKAVKQAARYHTRANVDDGVAHAIRNYALK